VLINTDTIKALCFFIFLVEGNVPNQGGKGVVSNVYEELYEKLMKEYNLPSKIAEDRYWMPSQYTRVWYNNPRRGLGFLEFMSQLYG